MSEYKDLKEALKRSFPDIPQAVLDWAGRRDLQLKRLQDYFGDMRAFGHEGETNVALGIIPRKIYEAKRAHELIACIARAGQRSMERHEILPASVIQPWVEELLDLTRSMSK